MAADLDVRPSGEHLHHLVRRVDGVELPVSGMWRVRDHHATISFTRPRALGHADSWRGRATEAAVIVGDDPADVTIALKVAAPELPTILGSPSRTSTRPAAGQDAMVHGMPTWQLHGRLSVNQRLLPIEATLAYHGVWRRGDCAYGWCAYGWFVLSGSIDDGARPRRRMRFTFELLADGPGTVRADGADVLGAA
jgi:hypothetical protein